MKSSERLVPFPVSQQELANYLGVSVTLLSMTKTGRHGTRELPTKASLKMTKLLEAHVLSEKANPHSPSLTKRKEESRALYNQLAKWLLDEASLLESKAKRGKVQLDKMLKTVAEDEHWIRTVDLLLAELTDDKDSAKDLNWLEHQKLITLERLDKNGLRAQVKLETQIELNKEKARLYKAAHRKLMSRMRKEVKGVKVKTREQAIGNKQLAMGNEQLAMSNSQESVVSGQCQQ
jgi:hypothetical protein